MNATATALRLLLGGLLAWWLSIAARAPELPILAIATAAIIAVLTLWRPAAGLIAAVAVLPAAGLLAPAPARTAELLASAFGAAWLLAVWRPLSDRPWPRSLTIPALVYATALVGSWAGLLICSAAGISPASLASFLFHSIPPDHLVFSSPEPETWVLLQSVTAIGMLIAAIGIVRDTPRLLHYLAWASVLSAAVLAAATLVDIGRQWASADYAIPFLTRYMVGERYALHLADTNAAGSWYAMAAVIAIALASCSRAHRTTAVAALVLIGVAIWLTGSRSAYLGVTVGLLILAMTQRRWPLTQRQIGGVIAVLVMVLLAGTVASDWRTGERGSSAMSARLRGEFLATSGRMLASSPIFGVGVGKYFDRSSEFMSDDLRALYGNENAHNYFAQQFAELGLVGGALFAWLLVALVRNGRTSLTETGSGGAHLGLYAGVIGYLSTCATGHPLLVPEAALPFWVISGAAAGCSDTFEGTGWVRNASAITAAAVIAAGISWSIAIYARNPEQPPPEYGFHQPVTDEGATFRWIVRHAVTYIPNQGGFLRLQVRAPQETRPDRPLIIETSLAGRVVDRHEVPPDRWITYMIPVRRSASGPFQRVDLHVNQMWQQEVRLGQRVARRPFAALVADLRWVSVSDASRR